MEHFLQKFKALSDANRLQIIMMLKKQSMCACEILEVCECGQATLSHHMKILVEAGLVDATKEGKWVYYALNPMAFEELEQFMNIPTESATHCHCAK
ncbi:MAG: ArsR/SmtB family transcription factor [Erysipelotrichaceae bacterium]